MAEVALQAYENEIDQMIEEARYLEALAHLRHILGQYPRYLGAYYLLGKMLLEAELPDLAVDMFRRVLNADPEHFLARIGLGLAHERHGQLQAAIWNLQQAFDLAPGDEAIHDELCRLMGQDSGVTPDHIPMSRAGLARLYLRGGLFNRAVEEFRTLVAENPDRVDLQVALAEAYWRDDQIVLAAEQCQRILDVFPYCLKANLLLGTLLQNSGQESGGRYLQRAQEVDPENQVAEALFGSSSPWPRTTKTIERLLYDPAALDVDQKTRWFHDLEAASVSVGISEALPQMSQAEMQLVDMTASLESQIEIPDWLRELTPLEELAGGETPEEPAEAEVAEPESTISYEDLASWLQPTQSPVAPEPAPPAAEAVLGPTAEEEIPDWLRSLQPAGPTAIPPRPSEEEFGEEALPDWLAELRPPQAPAAGIVAEGAPAEELPDWLAELQPPAAAKTAAPAAQPAEAEALFGWDAFASAPAEAAAAAGEEALEELPDWLAELQPPAATETAAPAVQPAEAEELFGWDAFASAPAEAAAAAGEEALEELPDWLAELQPPAAAKAPAAAEELPDWLAELQPPAAAKAPAAAEELPDWLAELQPPAGPAAPALEGELLSGDDALAWLASLAAGKEEELRAQAETETRARVDEIMGRKPAAPLPTPPAAPAVPVAEEIVAPVEAVAPEAAPALEGELLSGDDALAWLASLAAGKEEELRAQAETESRARVDEIMGRKPTAPLPIPPAAPAAPLAEEIVAPVEAVAPEAAPAFEEEALAAPEEAVPAGAPIVAGTEEETFFGWLTFDAEIAEAPKVPEPEILEPQPLPSFGFTRFGPNGEPLMEQGPEEIKIAGPILVEPEAVKPEMVEAEAPVIPEPAPTAPLEALRARTEADARDYLTRLELARALVSANEWQEALTHYRRLIRDKQRLPEIEADLTQLTGRQPDDPRLLQMLGDLHMQKGQLDQALALYKRAISLL